MRHLNRNKQTVYYATYVSKTENTDEYGNPNGEYTITYSDPVETAWNVRGVDAEAEVEMFGVEAKDTIKIIAEKPLPIDEESILWYGATPATPYVATEPGHNYVVAGILPTLNDGVFYATKVDV